MAAALRSETKIDGYRLIRPIGSGGFGDVWLCCAEVIDRLYAIKVVPIAPPGRARRELEAIKLFKNLSRSGESLGIMPIEHVGIFENSLFYTMPLADGVGAESPEDPGWKPLTLTRLIEQWKLALKWPSSQEIKDSILPVARAIEALVNAGLAHRDIKPENVLILGGRAVLSDISLLEADGDGLAAAGTPGFCAPHWYLGSGGHPDMFGLAATLYTALSGNAPEKLGRSAFMWPPQGRESLSAEEQKEWKRLHRVIFRAMEDRPAERFVTFGKFAEALVDDRPTGKSGGGKVPPWNRTLTISASILIALGLGNYLFHQGAWTGGGTNSNEPQAFEPAVLSPEQREAFLRIDGRLRRYRDTESHANVLTSLDVLHERFPGSRNYPEYSTFRAIALYRLGRSEDAVAEMERGLSGPLDYSLLRERTELWRAFGHSARAEQELTEVIEQWDPDRRNYLARAHLRADGRKFDGVDGDLKTAAADHDGLDQLRTHFSLRYPGYRDWLSSSP